MAARGSAAAATAREVADSQRQKQSSRADAHKASSSRGVGSERAKTADATGRAIGIGSSRNATRQSNSRRNEPAQAPWRSSLDLVWSYSRSQAFHGVNITTSPSFAEHRWAGPAIASDSSMDDNEEEHENNLTDTSYDEDDDAEPDSNGRLRSYGATGAAARRGEDDILYAASPAAPMDWQDEQLPRNAVTQRKDRADSAAGTAQSRVVTRGGAGRGDERDRRIAASSHRGVLGHRDKQRALARSPRDPERSALDRRLMRLADNDDGADERSRSRSRSPKRVFASRPSGSQLQSGHDHLDGKDQDSAAALSDTKRASRVSDVGLQRRSRYSNSFEDQRPSEATPLLRQARGDFRVGAMDGQEVKKTVDTEAQKKPRRIPSWLRKGRSRQSRDTFEAQGFGSSTFWQSWFNTVNALVGVGILALPLAISYAGLVLGVLLFLLCGLLTNYTGKVLGHIMAAEPSLRTYADIGNFAFGPKARVFVTLLFCVELWTISTALIILFGDSVRAVVISSVEKGAGGFAAYLSTWPSAAFKAFGIIIVLPTCFLPLRLLSPVSIIGIISVVMLLAVVFADGIIKPDAPGSLRDPIPPELGPQWMRLPLSFGLIMSGFSSHPVIPSLFKDMRNPAEFSKMLDWAYIAATAIYLGMGLVGYLMFGRDVSDEITRNLAHTKAYPRILNTVALSLIIVSPLCKFALAARPVVTTLELLLGVEQSQVEGTKPSNDSEAAFAERARPASVQPRGDSLKSTRVSSQSLSTSQSGDYGGAQPNGDACIEQTPSSGAAGEHSRQQPPEDGELERPQQSGTNPLAGSAVSLRAAQRTVHWSARRKIALRIGIQVAVTLLIGATAIALPGFEKVMAFLGAFLACATCIFWPLLARIRVLRHDMTKTRIAIDIALLFIAVVVATLGTVWTFLASSSSHI